jgi:hypothetical protein
MIYIATKIGNKGFLFKPQMMSEHLKNPKTKLRMLRIDFKG